MLHKASEWYVHIVESSVKHHKPTNPTAKRNMESCYLYRIKASYYYSDHKLGPQVTDKLDPIKLYRQLSNVKYIGINKDNA
jgi:hypothetical protein